LPGEVAASIESIELRHDKDGNPIRKSKLHAKMPAITKLGEHFNLWEKEDAQSQTNNFFAVFLECVRTGEIEEEMKLRGLLPKVEAVEGEVVREEQAGSEPGQ